MEPNGGNLYRPHPLMVISGEFWRCKHGTTGFGQHLHWDGCLQCADGDYEAFKNWASESAEVGKMVFWTNRLGTPFPCTVISQKVVYTVQCIEGNKEIIYDVEADSIKRL